MSDAYGLLIDCFGFLIFLCDLIQPFNQYAFDLKFKFFNCMMS